MGHVAGFRRSNHVSRIPVDIGAKPPDDDTLTASDFFFLFLMHSLINRFNRD